MSQLIKVLSFDLDDTLWPCSPTIINAEKLLYQWLSALVPEITEKYDLQQLRNKRLELLARRPELSHNLTNLRMFSFEELAEELGLSSEWMEPAFKVFYEARQVVTLFEDVKPVLDELSKKYRLVSLTNGNADTVKTGINHWFDYSLNSESVGKSKSEPDIYRQVQQVMSIEAHHMIHIGDDPINDILGAQSAGVFSVWLNRQKESWVLDSGKPDAVIHSLSELPALLEELSR